MFTNSKPSTPAFSINIPKLVEKFSTTFFYNFYTTDESTQENPVIPDVYKKQTIIKNDVNLASFSLRIPRYIELSWATRPLIKRQVGEFVIPGLIDNASNNSTKNPELQKNYSKIFTQDNIISSKHVPYSFSSYEAFDNAAEDINKNVVGEALAESGISQASILENFVTELLKDYEETPENPKTESLRQQIRTAIESIESFVDKSDTIVGYKFFDNVDKKLQTAFDEFANQNIKINSQINNSVLADVFNSSTLPGGVLTQINSFISKNTNNNATDVAVQPVSIGGAATTLPDGTTTIEVVGYTIDKYKFENDSYVKDKTIFVENVATTSILDVNVKYGGIYMYAIRPIVKFEMPSVLENSTTINTCTYYFAGKPETKTVICKEDLPPPAPIDVNFVWNFKQNQFYVNWQMPFNSQRDIKQFQVFRRKSIYEPFELLEQHCFDLSDVKQTTGELVDGNNLNMTKENSSFVKYSKFPTYNYHDKDFKLDYENLISSKYIYAIACVDAHGLISNYSVQYEVTFDFFKNQLVKKLISISGAPRPYPNLLLNVDLFKDIIQVSGLSSQKLKIYFMPEYFKIRYNSGKVEKMVATKQDGGQGGYYKLQFINVQNQKSDQLKINIDDPKLLATLPLAASRSKSIT